MEQQKNKGSSKSREKGELMRRSQHRCGIIARLCLTHETNREIGIGADLAINLNVAIHDDDKNFATGQGILETVTQQDDKRDGFTKLVRTRRWTRGPGASKLVKHPVLWRM